MENGRCRFCFSAVDLSHHATQEDLLTAQKIRHRHMLHEFSKSELERHLREQYSTYKPDDLRLIPHLMQWYYEYWDERRRRHDAIAAQRLAAENTAADAMTGPESPRGLWQMRPCPQFVDCQSILVYQEGWWRCLNGHGAIDQAPYSPPEPLLSARPSGPPPLVRGWTSVHRTMRQVLRPFHRTNGKDDVSL